MESSFYLIVMIFEIELRIFFVIMIIVDELFLFDYDDYMVRDLLMIGVLFVFIFFSELMRNE